jgi:DNA-binding CsgD family transcriptional regulator
MKDPKAAWNPENPWDSEDPAFRRILQDERHGSEQMSMAGMTQREQDALRLMAGCSRKERKEIMERRRADTNQHLRESFLLLYGSRKERKAIKERRKAREQAKKQSR